jgi:hypothetical protein
MKVPKVVRRKVVRRKEPKCEWMIPVTRAIQNLKKKQTLVILYFSFFFSKILFLNFSQLFVFQICFIDCKICCNLVQHVPSWVVQDCLPHRTKIYLRSADTNRRYSWPLLIRTARFRDTLLEVGINIWLSTGPKLATPCCFLCNPLLTWLSFVWSVASVAHVELRFSCLCEIPSWCNVVFVLHC